MIIQSKRVWIAGQFVPAGLVIRKGQIETVCPYRNFSEEDRNRADCMDYGSLRIVPGFLDLHTHGAYGFDTNDADPEGLRDWMRRIPEEGVTSILPTTVTQLPEVLTAAVQNVAAAVREGCVGAQILGIHFEGPYLNPQFKGAQPPEAIARPDVEEFCRYQEAADGLIRYITLAPEMDEDFALTRYCAQHGVRVSMGHSAATYEQARQGIENGAVSMTHVFNGMSPMHHREPGMVGAALHRQDVYGEIICDGHHVHPTAVSVFFAAKGKDHAVMVTDSLCAKGAPAGMDFFLGGHEIEVGTDGLARLKGTQTIAGSTLRMNRGLKMLAEEAGVPFEAALASCTVNPARCLGVADRKGQIAAGYDADLVVLEEDYEVRQTYCRGRQMLQQIH